MRWMLAMLVFIPVSILLHFTGAGGGWMFLVACLAIIPLAGFMGTATEELAKYRGPAIGGLLNATFGNATELIISLIALRNGEIAVVKSSLIGSIIGNLLLVLGLSALLGGIKHKTLTFQREVAQNHATMMGMAVIGLLLPALFVRQAGMSESVHNGKVLDLSLGVAGTLLALYVGSLLFSLKTHESLYRCEQEEAEKPSWPQKTAVGVLGLCAVFIALESDFLVRGIEPLAKGLGLSRLFIGVILIPIVGNAAEHSTAVSMALKNKMDISLNIAVSSSAQIALFVTPVVIFAGLLMGRPMTILFSAFELTALTAACAIGILVSLDGETHWLEGAQLLATYIIAALAFYFAG